MSSVRERIIDEIESRLMGLDSIGLVLQSAEDPDGSLAAKLSTGESVVEILYRSEGSVENEGVSAAMGTDHVTLPVEMVVHLAADYESGERPASRAAKMNALIYGLYSDVEGTLGRWGDLALHTSYKGGGGYIPSDIGAGFIAVEHGFDVSFRFTIGDMDSPR